MKPSIALDLKRGAVREAASRFRTENPRIFGSVLHGTDQDGSDLDLLVDALPGATLFDLGGLQVELETLLGIHVHLFDSGRLADEVPRQGTVGGAAGMNENRLPDYLDHMQQAAMDACSFVDGLGKDDLTVAVDEVFKAKFTG